LQATRLRRRQAEGKRAQTGLLLKVLRRTRRAPEPYRWAQFSLAKISLAKTGPFERGGIQ